MPISLGELATQFGCELIGDPDIVVSKVASLPSAGPDALSFLSSSNFKPQLASTEAGAVILRRADAADSPVATLIHSSPYACYARMAAVVCPGPAHLPGIHETAIIDASATVAASASIGPHVVIGERTEIGENVAVGPGSYVGPDCKVGDNCRILANVTLARAVQMGQRCIIHPGAVLGADGFGNAMTPEGWVKVPQLGGVRIGDDVEIGANSTVDCGAIEDTVLEDGVRIDNLCMIGHNCHIGAHTAMAGMSGIAGSTTVGKRCMFAGMAGAVGHITICDDVIVAGKGMISKDITEPGTYASNFPAEPAKDWSRRVARVRRLDTLAERVRKLERGE